MRFRLLLYDPIPPNYPLPQEVPDYVARHFHKSGYLIYENVWQHNPELLEVADNLAELYRKKASESANAISNQVDCRDEITLELIKKMVEWDKRRRILEDWKWKAMKDVADGIKPLTDKMKYAFYFNLQKLRKAGFSN